MKRYVIAVCLLLPLCGCKQQFEYPQGVDHAAEQLGSGWDSADCVIPTNLIGTNTMILPPSLTNSFIILDPKSITDPSIPIMYPYSLHERQKIAHGYEWRITQDVSGMLRNAGKLRLYGKNNSLIVDAPNDVVEAFVIKTLELESPTTKSTVPSEGAPSDVQ